jgi:2-polyprenyl-3-methyl-5-hydroxy-6-metoxy-1,4-benzoquinol methylase
MTHGDRERWDARYAGRGSSTADPASALLDLDRLLPTAGTALDLAGGDGRHAVWLARRGLDVTLADISPVGLMRAEDLAERESVLVRTLAVDLEHDQVPAGPWSLVLCTDYLQRDLWARVVPHLAPGGRIVWIHPTHINLERHPRPSERFLLAPGEAAAIIGAVEPPLRVVLSDEGWCGSPLRHLARVVADRP